MSERERDCVCVCFRERETECVCACVCVCNFLYHGAQINFWGHSEHKFRNSRRSIDFLGSSLRGFFYTHLFFKMAFFGSGVGGIDGWTPSYYIHRFVLSLPFLLRVRARARARVCVCVAVPQNI